MPKPHRRRFTLADLMALVAATALGLALSRWLATRLVPRPNTIHSWVQPMNWAEVPWLGWPSCLAATWTLALVGLRWRRPRPSAAMVLRQPGAVASLAAVLSMLLGYGLTVAFASLEPREGPIVHLMENSSYWSGAVNMAPLAIAGAWMALALGGRWSPEGSWLDRLGIALGLFWLAWYPVNQLG